MTWIYFLWSQISLPTLGNLPTGQLLSDGIPACFLIPAGIFGVVFSTTQELASVSDLPYDPGFRLRLLRLGRGNTLCPQAHLVPLVV